MLGTLNTNRSDFCARKGNCDCRAASGSSPLWYCTCLLGLFSSLVFELLIFVTACLTVSLPLAQTLNNRKKRLVELIENLRTSARSLLLLEINLPMTGATRLCLRIKGRSMFGNWFTFTFSGMMLTSVIQKCFLWFALQSIQKSMLVIPP
jgi:hypothetical protein